jgi:hypothetical protein
VKKEENVFYLPIFDSQSGMAVVLAKQKGKF